MMLHPTLRLSSEVFEFIKLNHHKTLALISHRKTDCLDDRLLTMMTDTGYFVPWRVGYNFRLVKLLENPSGTLWWVSTLVSVERSYRNKLTLFISQTFLVKPCWRYTQYYFSNLIWWVGSRRVAAQGTSDHMRRSNDVFIIYLHKKQQQTLPFHGKISR